MRKEPTYKVGSALFLFMEGDFRNHFREEIRDNEADFTVVRIIGTGQHGWDDKQWILAETTDHLPWFTEDHPLNGCGILLEADDPHVVTRTKFLELCYGGKRKEVEFSQIAGFDWEDVHRAIMPYRGTYIRGHAMG